MTRTRPDADTLFFPIRSIIAIHGLNPLATISNAHSTWTAEKGKESKNWLRDAEFLPAKLPHARIMLFGYNSSPAFASSNAGLNEHAKNLLFNLRLRRQDCPQRPIVFICHSLGGLLAKRAIVIAHNNDIDKVTYTATHGFVFSRHLRAVGTKLGWARLLLL